MIYRRNGWWYCDNVVNGVRIRRALKTQDKREAKGKEKALIAAASAGKQALSTPFSKLPLSFALEMWISDRAPRLAAKSVTTERQRALQVSKYLGKITVEKLTSDDVLGYLRYRKSAHIANATMNRELDVIRGVLKRARRWHLFDQDVKPFSVHQDVGRALEYDEKVRLLKIAGTRPEWLSMHIAIVLALNTTARSIELKHLRWRDIDFLEHRVTIRRSKTEAGQRVIPLNDEALRAIQQLWGRANAEDANNPDHFLFYACESGTLDPTKPQTSWRTSWRRITRCVNCPECGLLQNPAATCSSHECAAYISRVKSPLAGLRFHDLRHDAITTLAECQASDQVIM